MSCPRCGVDAGRSPSCPRCGLVLGGPPAPQPGWLATPSHPDPWGHGPQPPPLPARAPASSTAPWVLVGVLMTVLLLGGGYLVLGGHDPDPVTPVAATSPTSPAPTTTAAPTPVAATTTQVGPGAVADLLRRARYTEANGIWVLDVKKGKGRKARWLTMALDTDDDASAPSSRDRVTSMYVARGHKPLVAADGC